MEARRKLIDYVESISSTMDAIRNKIAREDLGRLEDQLREAQDWLEYHEDAEKEQLDEQMRDLQNVADPIIGKIYGGRGSSSSDDDEEVDDEL